MRRQRIARELREIEERADADGLFAFQNPSNWAHVIAVIKGPADSPYEGGFYKLDIDYPNDYPFKTCILQFDTKVWHPNIFHDTGAICSALLYEDWSPVYTLQKCLVVLQNLLHAPVVTESSQAANTEAAISLADNFETYVQKARYWTEAYALVAPPTAEEVAQWFATQPLVTHAPRFPASGIPAHLLQASPLLGQQTVTDNRIFGSSARTFCGGSSPSALISWKLETADDNARRRQRKYPNLQPELASVSEIARLSPDSAISQHTSGSPPAPLSWLALLLEGRTTPAFIALCELKLIQQEDFSSAELLAMVPESEFNCEYLTSLGITAKGLQIKLVNLHKELRETHRAETSLVTSPMLNAQDEGSNNHPHSPASVEATDGAIDSAYVHIDSSVRTN